MLSDIVLQASERPAAGPRPADAPAEAQAAAYGVYLAQLDAAPKTVQTYTRALRQYSKYLDSIGIGPFGATPQTIVSYKKLLSAGHAAATVNAYLCAVRGFYAWSELSGFYPNIARSVRGQRTRQHTAREALSIEQARALLRKPEDDAGALELRDYAIVNLMTRRGLRTIEVSRANIGDLRTVSGQSVLFVQGKGHSEKDDFVVLGDACMGPILDYLSARGDYGDDAAPLFAGIGNRNRGGRLTTGAVSLIAKKAMKAAGIDSPHITAHSLRHTAVTFALLGGATIQEAAAMARHASIETTMVYAHNISRAEARAERAADAFMDGTHAPNQEAQ